MDSFCLAKGKQNKHFDCLSYLSAVSAQHYIETQGMKEEMNSAEHFPLRYFKHHHREKHHQEAPCVRDG